MIWHEITALIGIILIETCYYCQSLDVPPIGDDYNERNSDGSYKFGFQTGDQGAHYHAAIGSKNNQVIGRFGSRDPASGKILETQYTAGRRGFRARGPLIVRQMDLSQNKAPFNSPVPTNSPNYQPSYDSYHDPNENPSYKFGFKTNTYQRNEASDSNGRVVGSYSYLDDVGEKHVVEYEAGAKIGFNVKTPFPESKIYNGLFYKGPPGRPGGKARGRSSIQQKLDGSYKFVANAPDHRRTEASDKLGNVRGSYTFIDDKGQQRSVEYIAGPNIGYNVVKKGSVQIPPFISNDGIFHPFPGNINSQSGINSIPNFIDDDVPLFSNDGNSIFGSSDKKTPGSSTSSSIGDLFSDNLDRNEGKIQSQRPSSKPRPTSTTTKPGSQSTFLDGSNESGYVTTTAKPVLDFGDFPNRGTTKPLIPGDLANNCCKKPGGDLYVPPNKSSSRPVTNKPPANLDNFFKNSFLGEDNIFDLPSTNLVPPKFDSSREQVRKNYPDNDFLSSNKNINSFSYPRKAHIQSLDLPYGAKLPSPSIALEHGITHGPQR